MNKHKQKIVEMIQSIDPSLVIEDELLLSVSARAMVKFLSFKIKPNFTWETAFDYLKTTHPDMKGIKKNSVGLIGLANSEKKQKIYEKLENLIPQLQEQLDLITENNKNTNE